jgi:hypothetical protein
MATKVKRSLIRTFLRTGSVGTPAWKLIGDGVTTAKFNYSPKTVEETYITDDSATTYLDSYAPTLPIEATAKYGDSVFDYVDTLRKGRSVVAAAETDIVNVWMYKKSGFTVYPAEKQACSIQVDDFGGDGGTAGKLNYTINFLGDPILGTFKPAATAAFYPTPTALTVLTTLTLGSGTLDPLFVTDPSNLFYTTSIAAATVTMASTMAGSTIVQKDNLGNVVNQGAAASLSLGANVLTITVTQTGETSIYSILSTRTV